jgi:hypothetical protein
MVEWAAANGSITPLDAISTLEGRSDGSAKTASVYVSITGLQLKAKRHRSCPMTWCSLDDHGSSQWDRMSVSLPLAG